MTTLNAIYCPNCKATLDSDAQFCLMCGLDQRRSARLRAEPAPVAYYVQDLQPIPKPGIPLTAASVAVIAAAIVMCPILVFCVSRHPLGCLLAALVIVLPLTALFHKQLRRSPIVLAAITCCLFLFTNQILDKVHDNRMEAIRERQSAMAIPASQPLSLRAVQQPIRALPPGTIVSGERIEMEPVVPRQYGRRFRGGGLRRFLQSRRRREARGGAATGPEPGIGGDSPQTQPGNGLLPRIPGLTGASGDAGDD